METIKQIHKFHELAGLPDGNYVIQRCDDSNCIYNLFSRFDNQTISFNKGNRGYSYGYDRIRSWFAGKRSPIEGRIEFSRHSRQGTVINVIMDKRENFKVSSLVDGKHSY